MRRCEQGGTPEQPDDTNLPNLLLRAEVGALIAELLKQLITCEQVLRHAVALDVHASVTVVELLVAGEQLLVLTLLDEDLVLNHAMTFYTIILSLRSEIGNVPDTDQ